MHLSYELHDEVHHKFRVLVEHALPQFVHHPLGEVEDVVDQNLVTTTTAEGQRGIFTWREMSTQEECILAQLNAMQRRLIATDLNYISKEKWVLLKWLVNRL